MPWLIDEEACKILSYFTKLKGRLEPYLTSESIEGVVGQGLPIMRPMFLEFPEDRTAWLVDEQYMLGQHLLVAPVFGESEVEYYLPSGVWTNLLTGSEVTGSRWVKEDHTMATLPLLLRPGSALIIGKTGHLVVESISKRGFTVLVSRQCLSKQRVSVSLRGGTTISISLAPMLEDGSLVGFDISSDMDTPEYDVVVVGQDKGLLEGGLKRGASNRGACKIML